MRPEATQQQKRATGHRAAVRVYYPVGSVGIESDHARRDRLSGHCEKYMDYNIRGTGITILLESTRVLPMTFAM
jgi:hypothetical protein